MAEETPTPHAGSQEPVELSGQGGPSGHSGPTRDESVEVGESTPGTVVLRDAGAQIVPTQAVPAKSHQPDVVQGEDLQPQDDSHQTQLDQDESDRDLPDRAELDQAEPLADTFAEPSSEAPELESDEPPVQSPVDLEPAEPPAPPTVEMVADSVAVGEEESASPIEEPIAEPVTQPIVPPVVDSVAEPVTLVIGASGSGTADLATGADQVPAKRPIARLPLFLAAAVLAVLLIGVGAAVWLTHTGDLGTDAKAGDCLSGVGVDPTVVKTMSGKLTVVPCSNSDAKYRVLGRVDGRAESEATETTNMCDAFTGTQFIYWEGPKGKRGTVLCLASSAR